METKRNAQYTQGENTHESELLRPRELQLGKERHRHNQQSEISSDVHPSVEEPDCLEA